MRDLVIFGTSPLAKLANYYATQELGFKVVAFVVDKDYWTKPNFLNQPVLTWPEFLTSFLAADVSLYVAVGYKSMRARAATYDRVKARGYELINIVSSASYVANDVMLGDNNFVMPGVVIEAGVAVGSNNVVWSNTTICHDTCVGNHNFIAANTTVGGGVKIGNGNFFGFSTVIKENLKIGDSSLVGAGSLVIGNIANLTKVIGTPAKSAGRIDSVLGVCIN